MGRRGYPCPVLFLVATECDEKKPRKQNGPRIGTQRQSVRLMGVHSSQRDTHLQSIYWVFACLKDVLTCSQFVSWVFRLREVLTCSLFVSWLFVRLREVLTRSLFDSWVFIHLREVLICSLFDYWVFIHLREVLICSLFDSWCILGTHLQSV